jgi:hypothetical protein
MVGVGKVVVHYFREAVQRIHDRLALGTPLFHGHAPDNNTAGREVLGEVVGKSLREVGGKLYDVVAAWISPEHRGKKLDICSIEANVELTGDPSGYRALDVGDITGIALGDSGQNSPAFAGATLLAAVQCLVAGGDTMTLADLKKGIEDLGAKPGDLFDAEKLKADAVVESIVKAEKQTEYEHAKRVESKLAKEREDRAKAEADYEAKLGEMGAKTIQLQARGLYDGMAAERKLTEPQKTFLERQWNRFKSEAKDEGGLKQDLQKFLDEGLTEFADTAKLFGVKAEADGLATPPSNDGGGNDLTDPKNNSFIPE